MTAGYVKKVERYFQHYSLGLFNVNKKPSILACLESVNYLLGRSNHLNNDMVMAQMKSLKNFSNPFCKIIKKI